MALLVLVVKGGYFSPYSHRRVEELRDLIFGPLAIVTEAGFGTGKAVHFQQALGWNCAWQEGSR